MEALNIQNRIFTIRGMRVMIDFHLSELYDVETKAPNQAVRRNTRRFPEDFMFQLNNQEWEVFKGELVDFESESTNLRSQIVTSNPNDLKWRRYMPFVFTEQGVAMLSSVLKSERAIDVNIMIMRTFVVLRQNMANYAHLSAEIRALETQMNRKFKDIHEAINYLMSGEKAPEIGFKQAARNP